MTNEEFRNYLQSKLGELRSIPWAERPSNFRIQEELLTSGIKIMTFGTGQARRRFRREYERRLGL